MYPYLYMCIHVYVLYTHIASVNVIIKACIIFEDFQDVSTFTIQCIYTCI